MKVYNVEDYIEFGYHAEDDLKVRDQEQKIEVVNYDRIYTPQFILDLLGKDVGELFVKINGIRYEIYDKNDIIRRAIEFGFYYRVLSTKATVIIESFDLKPGDEVSFQKGDNFYSINWGRKDKKIEYDWENSLDHFRLRPGLTLKERVEDLLDPIKNLPYGPFRSEKFQQQWYCYVREKMLRGLKFCLVNGIELRIFEEFEERLDLKFKKDWIITSLDSYEEMRGKENLNLMQL